jgi:hypothetical protein
MRIIVLALVGLTGAGAFAQSRSPAAPPPIKDGVTVRAKYLTLLVGASDAKVAPGGRVTLLVQVTPNPKIHVYAPGQDGYLPVDLTVTSDPAFSAKPPLYPASKPFTFAPTAETVKVYAEPFLIRQDLVIASSTDVKRRAATGDGLSVTGAFQYQACDDAVCYRPETVAVTWKLHLVTAATSRRPRAN